VRGLARGGPKPVRAVMADLAPIARIVVHAVAFPTLQRSGIMVQRPTIERINPETGVHEEREKSDPVSEFLTSEEDKASQFTPVETPPKKDD
jgi:hypothetical protein